MVSVEIYVPSVDKTYDFMLDETSNVEILVGEISEMIAQKESTAIKGKIEEFMLGDMNQQILFHPKRKLESYGIKVGSKLILV